MADLSGLNPRGERIADSGIPTEKAILFRPHILYHVGRLKLRSCRLQKTVIVLPEHTDIQVIVPRNKALVADGAQKSSVDHKIRQSMLFTDFIHPVKHLQLHIPDFLHFIRNSVIGNSFLLRLQFINIFPNQLSVRRHPPVKRPIGILFSHLLQKKHLFLLHFQQS